MNKPLCVYGVLKTELGLKIKDEMLEWLNPLYDITEVDQEPPGILFEYPAIKKTVELSIEKDEPVLYIHTKGAANPNHDWFQPLVRKIWKDNFGNKELMDKIYDYSKNVQEPVVTCLFTGTGRECWFNAFVVNPIAAKIMNEKLKDPSKIVDRYYYERMFREMTELKIVSVLSNSCNSSYDICREILKYR